MAASNGRPIRLRNELLRICYRGGGDLFPITGQLIGHFSPLPASAYIARRALYLFGTKKLITGKQFVPPERRINRFSDMDDKMQRIYPLNHGGVEYASHCYRGHEIPNYLQEGTEDWPRDIIRDALTKGAGGPKDTARFLHWNKRGMCMCPYLGKVRGLRLVGSPDTWVACRPEGSSCRKRGSKDIGDYEDNSKAPLEADNGNNPKPDLPDGIPFPFLPFSPFKMGIYEARPILKDDPATSQIVGGDGVTTRPGYCELTKKVKGTHVRVPEDFEDVRGKVNEGGIQCNAKDYRCAGGVYTPPKEDPILPNDRPVDPTTGEDSSRGDVREQIDCSNFEPEAAACRETLGEIQSLEGQELVNVNNQLATSPGAAGSVWLGTQTITYSGGGGLPMVINIGVPRCSYSDQAQAIRCGQTSSGEFCSFGPNPSPGCIQR